MQLSLDIADNEALARIQQEVRAHGGLMVPLDDADAPPQFSPARVTLRLAGAELLVVDGHIVQLAASGEAAVLVAQADRPRLLAPLPASAPPATVRSDAGEPLWARIAKMSKPEKIKLAKHGNADARRLLLKDPDPLMHLQILNNPGVTASEVAALIKGGAAGVPFLKQVLARSDLMAQRSIVEALVLCPKTPLNDAIKLMGRVSLELARRVAKTGRARGPVVHAAKKRVTR